MQLDSYMTLLQHRNEPVSLSAVPSELHKDLTDFMYGRTISKLNGEFVFTPGDYNEWVDKLLSRGVDYDVIVQ